jgi:aminoglycoside phosphotransferase (APT) family kinase protein
MDIEDTAQLLAYLRRDGRVGAEEDVAATVLTGGVSNRTVLVERPSGEAWVLKQALPKLRVPVDWFCPPERIEREALGLRFLARLAPPETVPVLVFEDLSEHLLAMQAVPQPHENWKSMLLAGRLEETHVEQFARLIARIHSQARGAALPADFADRTYFEALRLEPYYSYTMGRAPEAAGFLDALMAETRGTRDTLVHGDYSPKNVLVHRGKLVLLDHEVVHIGDPAFDIGFSMAHLLSKAHHLPALRERFAAAALRYFAIYMADAGADEPRCIRHSLACLLARVCGRSQLEYLDHSEKTKQRAAVAALMAAPPSTMSAMIEEFVGRLNASAAH